MNSGAPKKAHKKTLDNAPERGSITLLSVVIKIRHGQDEIECETPEEALAILKGIWAESQKKVTKPAEPRTISELFDLDSTRTEPSCWTRETFWKFVDSLGEPQKTILDHLVTRAARISDAELRELCEVETNQQLAGILSGISKQAAAVNVPARSVFSIETEFKGGVPAKFYLVSPDFLSMAKEMNWPAG
jgi:hypothetical protein